jgi:hypothetical protein
LLHNVARLMHRRKVGSMASTIRATLTQTVGQALNTPRVDSPAPMTDLASVAI